MAWRKLRVRFSSAGTSILVLDSYPEMRAALRATLESAGYLVTTAGDLGAAVDQLGEIRPHLLVIAPYIKSMPGHIAADYLRARHPGLPVLVVAGVMNDDRVRVQNSIREFHIFPSPFSGDELLAKVKSVLEYESERAAHQT
jgi:DNA-binding NtrC family response regulator